MKTTLLKKIVFVPIFLNTFLVKAQEVTYAITDQVGQIGNWTVLRKLDLQTGKMSEVVFDGANKSSIIYNAQTKKPIPTENSDKNIINTFNSPFGSNVAAAAYDKWHNRLYFTPMFIDQLRYIDLNTMKVYGVVDQVFSGRVQKNTEQGNIITRMVIASDGNGYAATNDGAHLIKFTTNKNIQITDLGAMVDDPLNNGVSIHSSCSSYGGDMIADDNNGIYILTARNLIFKINIDNKIATYLGTINGLPSDFTTNGAAVNSDNSIIVCSALNNTVCYKFELKNLSATPLETNNLVHSSDLANGNLYKINPYISNSSIEIETPKKSLIYPNPVTNFQFYFNIPSNISLAENNYLLSIKDMYGKSIQTQIVYINNETKQISVTLKNKFSSGVYIVQLSSNIKEGNDKIYMSEKLVVL